MVKTIRAPLFVPATRPERFAKAAASGADAIILDLEDAVGVQDKDQARTMLRADFTDLPVIVRINGRGTPWHSADVAHVAERPFAAVMLPKAETAGDIRALCEHIGDMPVVALVETARGLANAREIATEEGVSRLAFGSVDFSADIGCDHAREPLLAARSEIVLASRLGGLAAPIDGVTVTLDDPAITYEDARYGRGLGMGAKLCIHPKQIAEVMRAYAPTEAEISWARRVLLAGDGAVQVDGAMVDEPVRLRARAILGEVHKA